MGEAKRRKQLGLMPTVHPFEAELDTDAKAKLLRGPDDQNMRQAIVKALESTQLRGESWNSEYRTALVFTGKPMPRLSTVQDVEGIPVPPLRRITGELVTGKKAEEISGPVIVTLEGLVRLRDQQHSFDGQKWESFPAVRDVSRVRRVLGQHPAFALRGDSLGQFRVEHYREGRIDIDPEPPQGALEVLEDIAREWHGDTPEKWADFHAQLLEVQLDSDEGHSAPPALRRSYFEVRRPAPLHDPTSGLFTVRGGFEIYPLEDMSYSLDGETWLSYENPDAEPEEDDILQAFSEMLNMETVPVTVYADGRIEWEEDDIPAEHAERVRADLAQSTGAGNPEAWAEWTREMLMSTFMFTEGMVNEGQVPGSDSESEIPVPQAVRLDLAKDAIADPDPLSQTFIESEVTFDGETWRDLYDEEMPPELLLAIANMKPQPE